MDYIKLIEEQQMKTDIPSFRPGDTVKVHVKIVEGSRERIQVFEGLVIRRKGDGLRETFTVRRVSSGVSGKNISSSLPRIDKIEVVRKGIVRRAKCTIFVTVMVRYSFAARQQEILIANLLAKSWRYSGSF